MKTASWIYFQNAPYRRNHGNIETAASLEKGISQIFKKSFVQKSIFP